jgi:hypothetical protein
MAGTVHPGFLASTDRRGMLNVEASLGLPTVRVLRVLWAEREFLRAPAGGSNLTEGTHHVTRNTAASGGFIIE